MPPRICPLTLLLFLAGLVIGTSACKPSSAPANSGGPTASSPAVAASPAGPAVKSGIDVCALLTGDDLKNVQGEALKDAQRSDNRAGDLIVAQCYYALATASNSVVLSVTTADESRRDSNPRSFWQNTFGHQEEKGSEREREGEGRERTKVRNEGAKEEEGAPREKVPGLGEDAYWIASSVGGALYVLKQDLFFRLSIGGAGDQKAKLKKSKTLAQQVLKRI